MIPLDPEKKITRLLENHLHTILEERDLKDFREQLPVDFVKDASEGLDQIKNKAQLEAVLKQMNQQLHYQLREKKTPKRTHPIWDLSWTYWAIIVILLLTIAGFIVIRMLLHH